MGLFQIRKRRSGKEIAGRKTYDPQRQEAVLRCSICNGEQVAGFRDRESGHFEEVMLIQGDRDLERFRGDYGIEGTIKKIY